MEEMRSCKDEYDPVCLPPPTEAPWLLYTHGKGRAKQIQTFCTFSPKNNKSYVKSIPELRGKYIFSSCDGGWLILRDMKDKNVFSLFNIVSLRAINLPPLDLLVLGERMILSCILVLSPHHDHGDVDDESNFIVLLFAEEGMAFSFRPWMRSWTSIRIESLGRDVEIYNVVTCNGVIYGVALVTLNVDEGSGEQCLVVIEVDNYTDDNLPLVLKCFELEFERRHYSICRQCTRVVESCGQVYCVDISWSGSGGVKEIYVAGVWELNLRSMKWDRVVDSLEDRALFVAFNGNASPWCYASTNPEPGGIEANCVYIVHPDYKSILCQYKLKDCSLTYLSPCLNLQAPYDAPTWVTSLHQRLLPGQVHKQLSAEIVCEASIMHDQGLDVKVGINKKEDSDLLLLLKLPLELIRLIAERIHLFDYLNFRCTCKTLNSIAPPVDEWRSTKKRLPIFMFFENNDGLCRMMDPCRNDSRYVVIPLESFGGPVSMLFCKDGWLLLRTLDRRSLHYLNPFTKEMGDFPNLEKLKWMSSVGFSTCPTSTDCVTVALGQDSVLGAAIYIYYIYSGEDRWHSSNVPFVPFEASMSSPVYYEGAFCFLDKRGRLGRFQLVGGRGDQVVTWDVYAEPSTLVSDSFDSSHLVECNGELLSVFIGEIGRWVQVYKFNWLKMKWVRVYSLGNHMLFVSLVSSFSMVATKPGMRNRIYLPRRRGNDGFVFYHLETGMYGITIGEDSMKDLFGSTEPPLYCWI